MKKFRANQQHIDQCSKLYTRIKNRSRLINSSNPESVACGLVFYYLRILKKDIKCDKFSLIVELSDITVSNISKNISQILGTTDKIKLL